jgi:hypothetical protein
MSVDPKRSIFGRFDLSLFLLGRCILEKLRSPVHIGLEPPDLLADIGGAAQAKAGTDPASQSGWSSSTRFAVKRAVIEFWSVLFYPECNSCSARLHSRDAGSHKS